jgi:hypothetical protein
MLRRSKDEYKTPLAVVRGVFLCDNLMDTICSPVKKVELEDWEVVTPDADSYGIVSLPL